MKSKFAKEIFVTIEDAGTDNEYQQINKTAEEVAEINNSKTVARYRLEEILIVDAKATVHHKG